MIIEYSKQISATRRLAIWFAAHCNGDWEHSYGVEIETLDNPGWALHIDLADTPLLGRQFTFLKLDRSENDWVDCRVENAMFHGYGGIQNLDELIMIFLDWAEGASEPA